MRGAPSRSAGDSAQKLRGILLECVEDEAAWPEALKFMASAVGAESAILALPTRDPRQGLVSEQVGLNIDLERFNAFARESGTLSPWAEGIERAGGHECGAVLVGDQMCSRDEFETSPWYRELYEPAGIDDVMTASLRLETDTDRSTPMLGFQRPRSARRFDAADAAVLARFVPDVAQASRSLFAMRELRRRAATLESALMVAGAPVFIVDAAMAIVLANEAAARLLRANSPLSVRAGRLTARDNDDELEAGVMRALRDLSVTHALLPRPERSPLILRITAIPKGGGAHGNPCVLLVALEVDGEIPEPSGIAHGLKLTQAEGRIAHAIALSRTVAETAAELAVSQGTVRSHLKSIFQKLGIRRQAELVRLVGGLRVR